MCTKGCGLTISHCLNEINIPEKNIKINIINRRCELIIPDDVKLTNQQIMKKLEEDIGYPSFEIGLSAKNFDFSASGVLSFLYRSIRSSLYKLFYLRLFTADNLFVLSMIVMLTLSVIGIIFPILQIKLLFDIGLMLCTKIFSVIIQHYIINKNAGEESILDRIHPEYSIQDIDRRKVYLKDLQIDSRFLLSPGDYIPVDAIGNQDCQIIDTMEHGELLPVTIKAGEPLKQGMLIDINWKPDRPPFIITVKKTYQESTLSKIDALIRNIEQPEEDTKFNNIFKNILYFVVFLAILTVVVHCFYFLSPWQMTLKAAICVLTSACPCALFLNKNLVLYAVRSKMENLGIVCKNIRSLHEKYTDIVLDYTGTLTNSMPKNIEIMLDEKYKGIVYAIEKDESNIYARELCEALKSFSETKFKVDKTKSTHNSGISAEIDDVTYRIGNEEMFSGKHNVAHHENQHVIYIEKEENGKKQLIGHVKFTMELHPESKKIIKFFQKKNINVHICTGTNLATVKGSLEKAQLDEKLVKIASSKNPIEKLDYIKGLQAQDKIVIAVGDGGNDAAFLAQANAGIAMHSKNADLITQAVSTCCISNINQLQDIKTILEQGAQCKNRNDRLSLGLNIIVMLFPLLSGICYAWLGSLLMLTPLAIISCCTAYYTFSQKNIISKPRELLSTAEIYKDFPAKPSLTKLAPPMASDRLAPPAVRCARSNLLSTKHCSSTSSHDFVNMRIS
jgi:P-type E1-E2 ATPase